MISKVLVMAEHTVLLEVGRSGCNWGVETDSVCFSEVPEPSLTQLVTGQSLVTAVPLRCLALIEWASLTVTRESIAPGSI